MKKLLMFLVMLTVSLGSWATINVYSTQTTNFIGSSQVSGYGIYGAQPGEIAQLLAGTYTGTVYWHDGSSLDALKNATLVKIGSNSQQTQLTNADLESLENLAAQYIDIDGCTLASDASISNIKAGAGILAVSLPNGLTKSEVNAAGAALTACNANFGSCISQDAEMEEQEVTHYWFDDPCGNQVEYTGTVTDGRETVENITRNLTPVSTSFTYTNSKFRDEVNTLQKSDVQNTDGSYKEYYVPSSLKVELTRNKIARYEYNGVQYDPNNEWWLDDNGVVNSPYGGPGLPTGTQLEDVSTYTYTYTWRDNYQAENTYTYNGTPQGNETDGFYAMIENSYSDQAGYRFQVNYEFNYTYTNLACEETPVTYQEEKETIDLPYNQEVDLYTTTETVVVPKEGGTSDVIAFVNTAGTLYMATNLAPVVASSVNAVVISGNVTLDDISQASATYADPLDTSLTPAAPEGEGKFTVNAETYHPAFYINNAGAPIKDLDLSSATIDNPVYLRTVSNNSALERIVFPENLTRIPYACCYANGNSGNNKLKDIVFPQGLTEIGAYAFHDTAIEELYITNKITTIGHEAFGTCKKLKDLEFQAGLTNLSFGGYVFDSCTGLKHVTFPQGVTEIGNYIFNMCTALESIHLPHSLVTIGDGAFHQCSKMRTLVIPENVRSIGKDAFGLCYFEDIFLMAETPDKLPTIYSTGAGFNSYDHGTFAGNQLHGNNTSPQQYYDLYATYTSKQMLQAYRDAVSGGNTIANLHYTPAVKEFIDVNPYYALYGAAKEYEEIKEGDQIIQPAGIGHESYYLSDTYLYVDAEQATWPAAHNNRNEPGTGARLGMRGDGGFDGDYPRCSRVGDPTMYQNSDPDAWNYSPYATTSLEQPSILGWRQFVLRRGDANNEKVIIRKEYKDVWYTFCSPFDMSDEMLAIAFNEGFNICEFNGVEVDNSNIILHFNSIAVEDQGRKALALAYHPYMIHPNYMTHEFNKQAITGVYQEEKHISSSTGLADGSEFNTLSQAVVQGTSVELEGVSVSGNFYFIGNVDNPEEEVKDGTERTVFSGDISDGKRIKTIQGGDEVKLGDKLIPQYAYFLGTAPGETYPRYWKETAPNDRASGGIWKPYSAIIISDQRIENALGKNLPEEENPVKALEIDFSKFNPENVTAIEQVVEEAKANNVPVQYMNIVYDFNGNIVKKGDASLENLPEGMYIVNGKKYLVK